MKKQLNTLFKIIIRHPLEALGAACCYLAFRGLPMQQASIFGGWLARKFGPISSAQRTAEKNLGWVFPEKSQKEIKTIIEKVWDNFGRVIGEYPNLVGLNVYEDPRFEVIGQEYIDQLRDDDQPGIIFAAHLASWEVAIMAAHQRGLKVTQLYRATNNPYVDKGVRMVQRKIGQEVLTKGQGDARKVLASLRRGDHLFILTDQKMNRGVSVPFFGKPAMTAPAAARMALRFQCPLVPARVERLGGVRFRITYYPPMQLPSTKDSPEAVRSLLCNMNEMLEGWIKERPEQWLWLHNRWPKE